MFQFLEYLVGGTYLYLLPIKEQVQLKLGIIPHSIKVHALNTIVAKGINRLNVIAYVCDEHKHRVSPIWFSYNQGLREWRINLRQATKNNPIVQTFITDEKLKSLMEYR